MIYIGESAFNGCSGFTGSIIIPNWQATIGSSVFSGCTGLTGSVNINCKSISAAAFVGSNFSGSLYINTSYVAFDTESYYNGIQNFTGALILGPSVRWVECLAFYNSNCTSLTIPANVTGISWDAFKWADQFANIYCYKLNPNDLSQTPLFQSLNKNTCILL